MSKSNWKTVRVSKESYIKLKVACAKTFFGVSEALDKLILSQDSCQLEALLEKS